MPTFAIYPYLEYFPLAYQTLKVSLQISPSCENYFEVAEDFVLYNPAALTVYIYFGRVNGKGNGTPLWYSGLENPMDGGAW